MKKANDFGLTLFGSFIKYSSLLPRDNAFLTLSIILNLAIIVLLSISACDPPPPTLPPPTYPTATPSSTATFTPTSTPTTPAPTPTTLTPTPTTPAPTPTTLTPTPTTLTPTPTTLTPTPTTLTPTPFPTPTYPPPTLQPESIIGCNVTFEWSWPKELKADVNFAVRVGYEDEEPHSVTWTKEKAYTYTLDSEGQYGWKIVICRGEESRCEELAASEKKTFSFRGCSTNPTPTNTPLGTKEH